MTRFLVLAVFVVSIMAIIGAVIIGALFSLA